MKSSHVSLRRRAVGAALASALIVSTMPLLTAPAFGDEHDAPLDESAAEPADLIQDTPEAPAQDAAVDPPETDVATDDPAQDAVDDDAVLDPSNPSDPSDLADLTDPGESSDPAESAPAEDLISLLQVPGFPAPTVRSQQAYDPEDDFTARWTRADARQIQAMSDPEAPSRTNSMPEEYTMPTVPRDFPETNEDVWVWDTWTLTDETSDQLSFKGWEVIFALT
ncbi:MAG: glycoside hydrolase family 68 protein, partial [Pauljensenia sp.]